MEEESKPLTSTPKEYCSYDQAHLALRIEF